MKKVNCWEFKDCGREPRGRNSLRLGVCPVADEERLDGTHGGMNAGRACWVVAGSYCGGKAQGTFVEKYKDCRLCEFYKKVRSEEASNFELSNTLLKKLGK